MADYTIEQRASIRMLASFWRDRGEPPVDAMHHSLVAHRNVETKWYALEEHDGPRYNWSLPRRYRMFLAMEKL